MFKFLPTPLCLTPFLLKVPLYFSLTRMYFLFPLGIVSACPPPPRSLSWFFPPSEVEGDGALIGFEAPWRGKRDRECRPRQYIYPGESRKTSERFRTQPITSAERQEIDRYCTGFKKAWLCLSSKDHWCLYDHARQRES